MRRILISIKPRYASLIFSGVKKYEYRKRLPKEAIIAVVYATNPIKKVVGEFTIEGFLEDYRDIVWEKTKKYSGITKEDFKKYFSNVDKAKALVIGDITIYKESKSLFDLGVKRAPQSWQYI